MNVGDSRTYNYIRGRLSGINIVRKGRTVTVEFGDEKISIPPYPEVSSVTLRRDGGLVYPVVPSSWVVQWKANGIDLLPALKCGES